MMPGICADMRVYLRLSFILFIGGALSVANIGIAIRFSTNIVISGVSSHFIL